MKIAFIGTGLMGAPMAAHLQKTGHDLFLVPYSKPAPDYLLQAGAQICASHQDAAQRADIVITMVPDSDEVEAVLFAETGVIKGLSADMIVMDMSTISPVKTREFAQKISDQNCHYVDAPVSGGDVGAKNASLTIMVGADPSIFKKIEPLLKLMGKTITHLGDIGSGQTCKMANQIIIAMTLQAIAEGFTLAKKAGGDPARIREALLGGFASSRVLEQHAAKLLKDDMAPGFKLKLHKKDLNIALDTAKALGSGLIKCSI